jgi:hypothetical protein
MLHDNTQDDVVFFGSLKYLALFDCLTKAIRSRKIVFYYSASEPRYDGYTFKRFEATNPHTWQYDCVNAFLDGEICPGP